MPNDGRREGLQGCNHPAVRSGIERAIGIVVSQNLIECVRENEQGAEQMNELIGEAVNLLVKSR